ncbi:MAG TPA: glycoside hydrolase family 15 protein [Acidimicrobiales bacterium]|nr:glycoside hydrolase family 15 protein [Acidimicrobiales bacterium]
MLTDAGRVPLGARAWIGDGRTGALVAADGTVDWYCPDRFDAPAALYRLLDPAGGAVRVGPVREGTGARRRLPPGTQRYRPGTLVAETEMAGAGGRVLVVDFLPWAGAEHTPPGRLVRIVTAVAGPVDVEVEVVPGWSWHPARRVEVWSEGLVAGALAHGPLERAGLVVRSGFPLLPDPLRAPLGALSPRWRGVRRLDVGETFVVTVDTGREARDQPPLSADAARRLADDTSAAWRSWLGGVVTDGEYRSVVEHSALVARSLVWTPGGAPVAAPTASLPRVVGGERNADGRLVRWRDAAAAVRGLAAVGLNEDAEAAERWLRQAVDAADPGPWSPWRDVEGGEPPERAELELAGWRGSQPVVAGASSEPELVDLDAYGDVLTAVSASRRGPAGEGGDGPLAGATPALRAAADWLADHWARPDGGVWESVGPPRRLVASAVQAWAALDATVRRAQAANPLDLSAAAWREEAKQILAWLETDGVGADGGLRHDPGTDAADAALLRVAWRGPWPAAHPIVTATVDRTLERLASGLLVHRLPPEVDDGRAGTDSPDLLASLWAARAQAALGRWEDAHDRFEAVVALSGPLGLLSEAAHPVSAELLGNLPSAGVHLAVLDVAAVLGRGPR